MDVTCERCGTEYDFDDALVSERGTTVKCTNCSFQFRIFRPAPAAIPERWVVRTVDGRELVFSALRELQGAITSGIVGRDDVLSRGGARPRRLGSIAELEPFFKQATIAAVTSTTPGVGMPHPRMPTPHGLGPVAHAAAAVRQEASAAFSLSHGHAPSEALRPAATASEPVREKSGTLRPPPPVLDRETSDVRPRAAGGPSKLQNLIAADMAEPITMPREPRPSRDPGADRTPAVPIAPRNAMQAPAVVIPSQARVLGPMSDATIVDGDRPDLAETAQPFAPMGSAASSAFTDAISAADGAAARDARPAEPPPRRKPDESGVVERKPSRPEERERSEGTSSASRAISRKNGESEAKPGAASNARMRAAQAPSITPTPGDVRVSIMPESAVSPRFSLPSASRRAGSARWIVGVVLVGATLLLAATVGRKYFTSAAPVSTAAPQAADPRVAKLLDEGERALREGDLDGAKEQFDKASVLAEKDPQVAIHLAHLAVVRTDQRWLKLRLLPPGGAESDAARAELNDSLDKMKKAVEAARELAAADPAVRRFRIDALRMSNDQVGARKLVAELLSGNTKNGEDELTLAALDLAEEKPSWPTVIERLRSSVSTEGNLGRARAMLTYALAASGDVGTAKAEYDRLVALPKPHPLTPTLLAFMARVETDRPAASAASAAPKGPPSGGPAGPVAPGPGPSAPSGPGVKTPDGRVPDDYVAPGAGSVDVSDMGHSAPKPTPAPPGPSETPAPSPPAPAPAPAPSPPASPPGVDTSDLPGFKPQ